MKKRLKQRGQAAAVFICSLALTISVLPTQAENEWSLENKASNLQDNLNDINRKLLSISDDISSAEMQVEITNGEIMRTKDSLVEAELNEAKQYENMKTRIKYMYEVGNATMLEMLFSADNMSDFLNKADFIRTVSEYDREMLTALQESRKNIKEKKELLDKQQISLMSLQSDLQNRQQELVRHAKATSVDLSAYNAQLARIRAEKAAKLAEEAAANGGGSINGNNSIINNGSINVGAGDLDVFAAILDCEAKHDYNSMLAVATVIMNRVESSLFPNSIKEVIYASGQFEPVFSGKLDTVLSRGASSLAYNVAQDAINGSRLAAVTDCYFFLYAGATGRPGVNIGDNLFFPSW